MPDSTPLTNAALTARTEPGGERLNQSEPKCSHSDESPRTAKT